MPKIGGADLGPIEEAALGEERVRQLQMNCLCPGCPAYPEEDRGEKKAYCLRGDSAHKDSIDPKDCLCEQCEVYKHAKLYGRNFFCLEGPALKSAMRNLAKGRLPTDLAAERERARPAVLVTAGLDVKKWTDE